MAGNHSVKTFYQFTTHHQLQQRVKQILIYKLLRICLLSQRLSNLPPLEVTHYRVYRAFPLGGQQQTQGRAHAAGLSPLGSQGSQGVPSSLR